MAQQYITDSGSLTIPGAYPKIAVQTANSGLASTGVIMLVGEADAGPRFSAEADLETNAFGPDQLAAVVSKYKSGPLVDAFRNASSPANDPNITGAPNSFILVKTNTSTKASGALGKTGGGTWGTLYDKSYGKLGNLIYWQVTANQTEVVPSTGAFTFIPPVGTVSMEFRVNGGAAVTATTVANIQPAAFVTQVGALTGLTASGGVNRNMITVSGSLQVTVNPGGAGATVITLTRSVAWANQPVVGDTLVIPVGSAIASASQENVGAYVVTAVTSTTLTATKLSDAGKVAPAPVIGTITNPANVLVSIAAVTDAMTFSPVTISLAAGNVIDGVGKSLIAAETTTGTDLLSRTAYVLGTAGAVTWVSKAVAPTLLASSVEYRADLAVARQVDGVAEDMIAGGEIAMKIGYAGTTATMTISPTTLTTTVVGGAGASLTVNLADFPTIADLATYINSQTGYTCSVGTATLGQLSSLVLDEVSAVGICTTQGGTPCRVKIDAYRMFTAINQNSVLVQLGNPAVAVGAGLPTVTASIAYLSGGLKGGSSTADFTAAIDALAAVRGNFLVPLISRDYLSDISDGLTDSSSTYLIDSVNAYAKTHCLKMSTLKKRRNRQAFCSKRDSFVNTQTAAANLASFRVSMTFQDFKQTGSGGTLTQFQPWMGAALAAAMQAAGFYRALVNKGINTSGVLQADGSFSDKDDTMVEQALLSGLLPARKSLTGGFTWVSDQTTYAKDSNFVFNSIQAVYVADIIALSTAQRMEAAFVGQSVADVSAGIAKAYMEGVMADFMALKLIAPSDDAPKGFKNLTVQISGPAMVVSLEVKLAGAIYFIPISFLVSQVTQTA